MPALETVKVEPRSSSGSSLPARALPASSFHVGGELLERTRAAVANDRNDEPGVGLHRDTDVVAVEIDDLVALEPRIQLRKLLKRRARLP